MAERRWVALFSHTGEELSEVSKALGRYPDLVLCNRPSASPFIQLLSCKTVVRFEKHENIERILQQTMHPGDIVTLHGYMRIISPATLATGASFYNGHPGDIVRYPELRGKDPQQKVIDNLAKYPTIGCVIHVVTPEVDAGKILARTTLTLRQYPGLCNEKGIYDALHCLSTGMWVDFLREVLSCKD